MNILPPLKAPIKTHTSLIFIEVQLCWYTQCSSYHHSIGLKTKYPSINLVDFHTCSHKVVPTGTQCVCVCVYVHSVAVQLDLFILVIVVKYWWCAYSKCTNILIWMHPYFMITSYTQTIYGYNEMDHNVSFSFRPEPQNKIQFIAGLSFLCLLCGVVWCRALGVIWHISFRVL